MTNYPLISVIIPIYNVENYLSECLDSIINQTYTNLEIICVDDGSTDSSYAILESYAKKDSRVKIFTKKNEGISKTLNYALSQVSNDVEYVARMDSDDISLPCRIKEQFDFMQENKDIDICGAWVNVFGARKEKNIRTYPAKHEDIVNDFVRYNPIWHPSVIIRNSFIKKNNVNYSINHKAEDYELWVRCLTEYNAKFANIQKILLNYRTHENQLTVKNLDNFEDCEISNKAFDYVWKKFIETNNNSDLLKPFKKDNNIAVVLACDNNYSKYLSVTVESIIRNSSKDKNYDLIVLDGGITDIYKSKILSQIENYNNFSIRFIDIEKQVDLLGSEIFFTSSYISTASYYRLFVPSLLKKYNRCLYLDVDIVVKEDISKLHEIDLNSNYIGACTDLGAKISRMHKDVAKDYCREVLGLDDNDVYFNAGVLLMDITKINEDNKQYFLFKRLKEIKTPNSHDQDILNTVFKGGVEYLDLKWNYMWNIFVVPGYKKYYDSCKDEIDTLNKLKSTRSIGVMHYADSIKPWFYKNIEESKYFWEYAALSPFYKELRIGYYINKITKVKRICLKIIALFIPSKKLRRKIRKL